MTNFLIELLGGLGTKNMLIFAAAILVVLFVISTMLKTIKLVITVIIIGLLVFFGWQYAEKAIADLGVAYKDNIITVGEYQYDMEDIAKIESYKTVDGKNVKIKFILNEDIEAEAPTELVVDTRVYYGLNAVTNGKLGELKEEPLGQ